MEKTGTNKLMDLWHEIQMLKGLSIKPISEHSKSLLIKKYDYYRNLGGSKIDHEIEEWKRAYNRPAYKGIKESLEEQLAAQDREIERLRKENATLKKALKQFIEGDNVK